MARLPHDQWSFTAPHVFLFQTNSNFSPIANLKCIDGGGHWEDRLKCIDDYRNFPIVWTDRDGMDRHRFSWENASHLCNLNTGWSGEDKKNWISNTDRSRSNPLQCEACLSQSFEAHAQLCRSKYCYCPPRSFFAISCNLYHHCLRAGQLLLFAIIVPQSHRASLAAVRACGAFWFTFPSPSHPHNYSLNTLSFENCFPHQNH